MEKGKSSTMTVVAPVFCSALRRGLWSLLLVTAVAAGCDSKGNGMVTGVVTYRQRIALPQDAVIRVRVRDVSLADAVAPLLGEQVIRTEGRQVPIPYAVDYDKGDIVATHRYSVQARIEDGAGSLLFISDTVNPVITMGNPTEGVEVVVVPVGG
jgi:putative lipoprotein